MAARMPMIATTIISSIRVKPCWIFFIETPKEIEVDSGCEGDYAMAVPRWGRYPRTEIKRFCISILGGSVLRALVAAPYHLCGSSHRNDEVIGHFPRIRAFYDVTRHPDACTEASGRVT